MSLTPETVLSPVLFGFFFFFLQLHLSFSLSTGGEDGLKEQRETELIPVQSLNLLLKSIGATLTDVQDVVFKYEHTQHLNRTQWHAVTLAGLVGEGISPT